MLYLSRALAGTAIAVWGHSLFIQTYGKVTMSSGILEYCVLSTTRFFKYTFFFKFLSADGYCVNAYLILVLNVMYNLCLNTTGLNKDKVHFFSRGDVGGTDLNTPVNPAKTAAGMTGLPFSTGSFLSST